MNPNSVLLILSLLVLSFFFIRWVLQRNRLRRARSWPKVEGRVSSSGVQLENRGDNQSALIAEVNYSYRLSGASASGVMRRTFFIASRANRWLSTYPVGRSVVIRYNPVDEKDSVLDESDQLPAANIAP
jgi:hypothetical protein